jgi:hypothetical protein
VFSGGHGVDDRRVVVDVDGAMSRWDVVMTCCDDVIHREAWQVIYLKMLVTEK